MPDYVRRTTYHTQQVSTVWPPAIASRRHGSRRFSRRFRQHTTLSLLISMPLSDIAAYDVVCFQSRFQLYFHAFDCRRMIVPSPLFSHGARLRQPPLSCRHAVIVSPLLLSYEAMPPLFIAEMLMM